MLKVLACHNHYQSPGGEDESFATEVRLLRSRGHEVITYTKHNDTIREMSGFELTGRTIWSRTVYREIRDLIRRERPGILHCSNPFPLLSPALYYAARRMGVPVVQSLRNYRLLCPSAILHRGGRICEDCAGRSVPWPGVRHRCYRGSLGASTVTATMVSLHRAVGTWRRAVDRYVALTEFARRKFIGGGLPPGRIACKPNFVHPDPGPGSGRGEYAVFAGRLTAEKGVQTLLGAWSRTPSAPRLRIFGEGPLGDAVRDAAAGDPRIEWRGHRPPEEVLAALGDARFSVMPSEWYETFGRIIVESYARAVPVIASRLGAMEELVDHGRTGLLFRPGDPDDLAAKIRALETRDLGPMRGEARREFEERFTAEPNYRQLLSIYESAIEAFTPARSRKASISRPR